MGGIWFTSDTHFRHKMVAGLRGFETPEAHDYEIVRRWNAAVRPEDAVWHLGDVGMGKTDDAFWACVDALNGTKHLITGNHDAAWPGHRDSHKRQREWLDHFASVQALARRRIGEHHVLLSHFPYQGDHTEVDRCGQYRLRDLGMWLLHGHTHSKERRGPFHPGIAMLGAEPQPVMRQLHVGLDAWDLTPVPLHVVEREIAA
ncbi:MAG TPA: metallophosphoesterase family protein [Streptosporangiaceae bacterium]|nr:metallophosphoesterase family protein [Streptosporangiaceae bacterium]